MVVVKRGGLGRREERRKVKKGEVEL